MGSRPICDLKVTTILHPRDNSRSVPQHTHHRRRPARSISHENPFQREKKQCFQDGWQGLQEFFYFVSPCVPWHPPNTAEEVQVVPEALVLAVPEARVATVLAPGKPSESEWESRQLRLSALPCSFITTMPQIVRQLPLSAARSPYQTESA